MAAKAALMPARTRGLLWAALTVTIFSGWFVVTRFGVTRTLSIWDITMLRFGIGAIVLAPVLLRPVLRPLPAQAWRNGLLFALLWGAPFVVLVALGLQLTSAAQAAAIAPTVMPVFAGLLGWLLLRETQGRLRWVGYGAIVAGLLGLLAAASAGHGLPDPLGLGALVLAGALWAVYTLLFRRSGLTPLQAAALICLWSTLLFLPVYLLLDLSRLALASPAELAVQGLYQGVLMSGVAIVAFNRAVALLGPSAASAIIAFVPVAAALLAIPVLGELPSPAEALAIACIAAGVLLAARPSPSPSSSSKGTQP